MKVYIVEDNALIFDIYNDMFVNFFSHHQVCGHAESAEQALLEIPNLCPDLFLIDISLPGISGIDFVRQIRPFCQHAKMIIVTGHDLEEYREAALQAGADTILSKNSLSQLTMLLAEYLQ